MCILQQLDRQYFLQQLDSQYILQQLNCCSANLSVAYTAGSKGQPLSPRSPLQSLGSPQAWVPSPTVTGSGQDKNAAFMTYKQDTPEGQSLDQASILGYIVFKN